MEIKRDYYPITEAAELLGCAIADLLHLGAQGRALVCVNIYGMATGMSMSRMEATTEGGEPVTPDDYGDEMPDGIFALISDDLRLMEMPDGFPFNLEEATVLRRKGWWDVQFDPPVPIGFGHLVMLHDEIVRLASGGAKARTTTHHPQPAEATSDKGVTVTLPRMTKALEAVFAIMRDNWTEINPRRLPKQINIAREIDAALGWGKKGDPSGDPSRDAKAIAKIIKPDTLGDEQDTE